MEKISTIIITYNEEENIASCIKSLQEISDEILVIDSKSNDRTRYIAQELGATVVETEWKGYSDTKNFGNNIAKNNWILSIDADEVLSEELINSFKNLKLDIKKVANGRGNIEKGQGKPSKANFDCGLWKSNGNEMWLGSS